MSPVLHSLMLSRDQTMQGDSVNVNTTDQEQNEGNGGSGLITSVTIVPIWV